MAIDIAPVFERIESELEDSIERLFALLRIPSISTDHAFDAQVLQAAKLLADDLSSIGFNASVRSTPGHPMVVAHYQPEDVQDAPHVLYYGHYDVQPPDPIDEWTTGPFDPILVEGPHGRRIVARGAVDDKGQVQAVIEAFRAYKAVHGSFPIRMTILFEGEEESGSPSLDPFLKEHKDELAADVCVVSDTDMWDITTPAITYMLRGLVYVEVVLHGPSHDLHSGLYGGSLVNPINALCDVLSSIHDDKRRVRFPHFYDGIEPPGDAEMERWKSLGFDAAAFLGEAGMKTPYGEADYTTLERIWSRPTCDLNGIIGGYTQPGAKTVISSKASAKLSCRLVPGQDAHRVLDGIRQFFSDNTPPDCRIDVHEHACSPAIRVATDSPFLTATRDALRETFDKDAVLIGAGGSIPVVGSIQKILGFDSILVGFGLDDDRVHSPNEKFEVRCFEMAIKSHAAMLAKFASLAHSSRTSAAIVG